VHELGIAAEAHRLARAGLPGPALRLARVWLAVGELSGVEPDLLGFAWEAVTAGGPDEGCALEIEWCPARQVCDTCGAAAERPPGAWRERCPACGGPLRVEGGMELDLVRLEADPAPRPLEKHA
jgi:Zn finger protein HypA/HybF involved in hydrogenase expression